LEKEETGMECPDFGGFALRTVTVVVVQERAKMIIETDHLSAQRNQRKETEATRTLERPQEPGTQASAHHVWDRV
jgi:hypothetical protein